MFDKEKSNKAKEFIDYVNASFSEMRSDKKLKVTPLVCWFTENINNANEIFTGKRGRRLVSHLVHGTYMTVVDGRPELCISVTWVYGNSRGAEPSLSTLSNILPSLTIDDKPGFDIGNGLNANLILDCREWMNLMPSVLNSKLYTAYINQHATSAEKEFAVENAQLILKQLYPTVSLELLQIAVDLGMVDATGAAFTEWLATHLDTKSASLNELPHNFE